MKELLRLFWNHSSEPKGYKRSTWVFIFLLSVGLAGYLIACLIAPGYRFKQLNSEFGLQTEDRSAGYVAVPEYELSDLVRQKAYLESRIIMAGTDSIGLVVNLRDSLVILEVKGVMIHKAALSGYEVDRFLLSLNNTTYAGIFSRPFVVEQDHGTIVKEPVFVQKAPRDTVEAANSVFTPDTVHRRPVFVTLNFTNGIMLCLEEDSQGSFKKSFRKFTHRAGNNAHQSAKNIWAILRFKIPGYEPGIRISLSGKDITSIYRALPVQALVAIYI
jgi:hypothetical protein